MNPHARVFFPESLYEKLHAHLFPGDNDEHAAILAAGFSWEGNELRLFIRDVFLAQDGIDFVDGVESYKTLKAEFIYPQFRYCRKEKLAYLAVHNHGGSYSVGFSLDDMNSHERNYPTLLSLAEGLPVGALVFARHAIAGDIWLSDGRRLHVDEARVVGLNQTRLYPRRAQASESFSDDAFFDRQILAFGREGRARLKHATVGVIGLGGAGSLIVEYLAHLGVGALITADPDRLSASNLSRVVGATRQDVNEATPKTVIASRLALRINPECKVYSIDDDFSKDGVARKFLRCDFLFLAADSMRARLVCNAMVQQYYIPGIQVGSKIRTNEETGELLDAFSVVRWMLPARTCLWCSGLISSSELAIEAKTDAERADQAYGTQQTNPSVITLNAVSASIAVTDFQTSFLGLVHPGTQVLWRRFKHLDRSAIIDVPSLDETCLECGSDGQSRLGRGMHRDLPTSSSS